MNVINRFFLILSAAPLISPGLAYGENGCMTGYEPWRIPMQGPQDCVPIPDYLSGGDQPVAPPPAEIWKSKWGAIALDPAKGAFGAADNATSKRKAQSTDLSICKSRGGKSCKVIGWITNQCLALAWGDSGFHGSSADTKEAAISDALKMCSTKTRNCEIYHSGCSYPTRIR
jgi:Domain of unknown function (DUF4189)